MTEKAKTPLIQQALAHSCVYDIQLHLQYLFELFYFNFYKN